MNTSPETSVKELIPSTTIAAKVRDLGNALTDNYRDRDLVALTICNGGMVFAADLIRNMPIPMELDAILISSYSGTNSTGHIMLRSELKATLTGRHVLVIDDILDSGRTLAQLRDILLKQRPADLRFCVLCDKPQRRDTDFHADYVGFVVPDRFIVGYGMDYNGRYRNLPYIGVLEE